MNKNIKLLVISNFLIYSQWIVFNIFTVHIATLSNLILLIYQFLFNKCRICLHALRRTLRFILHIQSKIHNVLLQYSVKFRRADSVRFSILFFRKIINVHTLDWYVHWSLKHTNTCSVRCRTLSSKTLNACHNSQLWSMLSSSRKRDWAAGASARMPASPWNQIQFDVGCENSLISAGCRYMLS